MIKPTIVHITQTSTLKYGLIWLVLIFLSACQANEFSAEEIAQQNAADSAVASLLFEKELDSLASYNVHKDGSVVIKFDASVSTQNYTDAVDALRQIDSIKGVQAEQGGQEVCPLTR
jgi:hypothetical protein